jgi:hypothetical protein
MKPQGSLPCSREFAPVQTLSQGTTPCWLSFNTLAATASHNSNPRTFDAVVTDGVWNTVGHQLQTCRRRETFKLNPTHLTHTYSVLIFQHKNKTKPSAELEIHDTEKQV